jgi:hypothetical protein
MDCLIVINELAESTNSMSKSATHPWLLGPAGLLVWSVGVLAGMLGLFHYQMSPAAVRYATPSQWPMRVHIARDPNRMTLVMSLHPRCPCSRASVYELEVLMAHAGDRISAKVIFVQPRGAGANWTDGDLWQAAEKIPGVSVAVDPDGADSLALGASTSGQVALFDPSGRLLFSGGITDGRGHEGDNIGLDAILSLVRGRQTNTVTTPVYGCPLNGPSAACKTGNPS